MTDKILEEAVSFANENKTCFLATNDGDQPTVRALSFWKADKEGFWFVTGTYQNFYQQLLINPKVEACFFHQESTLSTMLRIRGKIEFCNDPEIKQKAVEDRPFLRNMGLTADSPSLVIFRIPHGKATFWTNKSKNLENPSTEF
ncbi:MAG: pyridoxamine 5'-phosphate oxidase family protein [Candidatus Azobacteroides sp.]|nr:pyridoxamine 5'-phosphate oxidase family protein [Candidatus Azobacteroides sp.]